MPRSGKPAGRRAGHRTAQLKPRAVRFRPKPTVRIIDAGGVLGERDEAILQREIRKLASFTDRILAIRVTIVVPNRRLHREVIRYQIRIHVTVPLDVLAVKRQEHAQFPTAVQEAFKAARRQIQDYVGRHRLPGSPPLPPARGRVIELFPSDGYGFIEGSDGDEIYFHRNSVLDGKFGKLAIGRPVRYAAEAGRKGLQASTVVVRRA